MRDPLILHDNFAAHQALITQETIRLWGWKTHHNAPYSSDLSPPDFDLFQKLKEPLRGQRFHYTEDVKTAKYFTQSELYRRPD